MFDFILIQTVDIEIVIVIVYSTYAKTAEKIVTNGWIFKWWIFVFQYCSISWCRPLTVGVNTIFLEAQFGWSKWSLFEAHKLQEKAIVIIGHKTPVSPCSCQLYKKMALYWYVDSYNCFSSNTVIKICFWKRQDSS